MIEQDLYRAIQSFDLTRWVIDHGGEETQTGEWYLECPNCGKPKLVVNTFKRVFHCWICQQYETTYAHGYPKTEPVFGAGGLLSLIRFVDQCDWDEAQRIVLMGAAHQPQDITRIDTKSPTLARTRPIGPVAIPPPEGWKTIDGLLPYMFRRGISLADARDFGLFWCDSGRCRNRLVFPVWEQGKLVYWQARAMWEPRQGESFVKALNPPRFKVLDDGTTVGVEGAAVSTDVLFNLDTARNYPRVAITEGPIDAIRTGCDAVCTFGKAISPTQIAKLLQANVKAIDLIWDADARQEMTMTGTRLASLFDVRLVFLPTGDPGDHTRDELQRFRSLGIPAKRGSRLARV